MRPTPPPVCRVLKIGCRKVVFRAVLPRCTVIALRGCPSIRCWDGMLRNAQGSGDGQQEEEVEGKSVGVTVTMKGGK